MGKLFLAGIGGFIGSTLRYAVGGLVQNWSHSIYFPYGTLAVKPHRLHGYRFFFAAS